MAKWMKTKDCNIVDNELKLKRLATKTNLAYEVEKFTGNKMGYYLEHKKEWAKLLNDEPFMKLLYDIAVRYNTYECDWDCRVCEWMKVVKEMSPFGMKEFMKCGLEGYGITILHDDELEEEEE